MNLLRIRLTPQRHSAAPLTHPSSKEGFVDPNESNESLKNLALMVLMGLDKVFFRHKRTTPTKQLDMQRSGNQSEILSRACKHMENKAKFNIPLTFPICTRLQYYPIYQIKMASQKNNLDCPVMVDLPFSKPKFLPIVNLVIHVPLYPNNMIDVNSNGYYVNL